MGCGASRQDETALVGLCRQRIVLIRQASEYRYALAAAHAAYFNAIAAVSDALLRFARVGHVMAPPVVRLPSSGKGRDAEGSGASSATPLSHSLSEQGSHLHLSSDTEVDEEAGEVNPEDPSPSSSSQQPKPRLSSAGPSPNYYHMKSSSGIPTMMYWNSYGFSGDPNYYFNQSASPPKPATTASPSPRTPPPPPPQGSAWGFLDPFSSYEQFLPGYSPALYGVASFASSPSSSEIRAREGIPDLEDESKPDPMPRMRVKKEKMVVQAVEEKDYGVGNCKNTQKKEAEVMEDKEKEINFNDKASKVSSIERGRKGSPAKSILGVRGGQGLRSTMKGVISEEGSSLVSERSGSTDRSLLPREGARDVVEVLEEIKEEFQSAIICSEEISKLLEVGKMPYRSRNKILRVISSRISGIIGFHLSPQYLLRRRRHLTAAMIKGRSVHMEFEKLVSMKSSNLSSTLEKLFVWEKKLYRQVKDEEKLRAMYEKKCRRLESLDEKGAEQHKINSTRVSARAIRTKMSIALTSVDVISRKMHVIRDEELQPQLVELIQGLMKLWKFLLSCHQKQLRAIVASGNYNLTEKTTAQDSLTKATMDLELKLLHWYACFHEWMKLQNSFVIALNGWLMKWLPQDQGRNGVGAPPIFALSNHWHQALNQCSEAEVEKAIQTFAANMHEVWENLDDERRQNQRVHSLLRGYSAKLKILQREHGNGVVSIPNSEHIYDDDQIAALDAMKKRLEEAKAKHAEKLQLVQEIASGSLRAGLVPVFQSLSNYAAQALRAFEGLNVPN
ncbi:hypothetical protein HPP92_019390 [Vanilla planifolia]|uniref:Nitrate regulatory gene2 protein n=1 Tax=Vanilla planifolia TaxID=51239 RepID=A0A835Q388_VANPL|nr:hypothetical protein HPP92_019390 [Vanilla planifolia]